MTGYDMIIGTDLMSKLGLKLNFQDACVECASMAFKDRDATFETALHVEDIGSVQESTDRIMRILDATYEKADLEKITSECQHLNVEERESLLTLLTKYESLFRILEPRGVRYRASTRGKALSCTRISNTINT